MLDRWRLVWAAGFLACGACLLVSGFAVVHARGLANLSVTVTGVKPNGAIPTVYAYCAPAAKGHVTDGPNRSPEVRWSKGPAGTTSYAIVMVDTDAPTSFDTANQEGKTIAATLKRRNFFHWILVDIPPSVTEIPEGAESPGHAAKQVGPAKHGLRGANDLGVFGIVKGSTGGYDGPCPPWNDALAHHYHFGVYALNVKSLGLTGAFTGSDALRAVQEHVLASGQVVGVYSLNPDVSKRLK
jgi:Raf kinase inhibitor-like YbhB/YbcL family protein